MLRLPKATGHNADHFGLRMLSAVAQKRQRKQQPTWCEGVEPTSAWYKACPQPLFIAIPFFRGRLKWLPKQYCYGITIPFLANGRCYPVNIF